MMIDDRIPDPKLLEERRRILADMRLHEMMVRTWRDCVATAEVHPAAFSARLAEGFRSSLKREGEVGQRNAERLREIEADRRRRLGLTAPGIPASRPRRPTLDCAMAAMHCKGPGMLPTVLLFALVLLVPAVAQAQKRVALVIGNAAYKHAGGLANPRNDAADMSATLRKLGFTVIDGFEVDRTVFERKVRDFVRCRPPRLGSSSMRGTEFKSPDRTTWCPSMPS